MCNTMNFLLSTVYLNFCLNDSFNMLLILMLDFFYLGLYIIL